MNEPNIDRRREWTQLATADLESLLRAELEKEAPDDDAILILLHILEAREPEEPLVLTERERRAFERYQKKVSLRQRKVLPFPRWLSVAACGVLILGLLVSVIPQQAEAETFWQMLQRISNNVLTFFDREDRFGKLDYIYETDNPGLQEVYEAVVSLGITEPVVPTWLPDEYELSTCEIKRTPMLTGVWATFSNGSNEILYKLDVYEGEPAHQYYRDDTYYDRYERNGATYTITRNGERWSVIWSEENIECHLTLDCQEETLRRILKSIYVMEE